LLLALVILLTIFLVRQIYEIMKQSENRKNRIWVSLIVLIAAGIAFQDKSTWIELRLGKRILSASIYPDQLDIGRFELLGNQRYYALYGHIDWSCTFTGSYDMLGDTLILAGQAFEKTAGILADKYVMTDSTLIPVKTENRYAERTQVMRIEKN